MKKINKYQTTELFNNAKDKLNTLEHYIAKDVQANKIYLKKFVNPIVNPSESSPCDICLYDKTNDKLIIVKGNMWNIETYPRSKYSPVGVVLIPGTHDVYGDGSCCVISLKEMYSANPDNGDTDYRTMYWGGINIDIQLLNNYDKVCCVGSNGNVNETVQSVENYGYLPSDNFNAINNPYDTDTGYYSDYYGEYDKYIPSPYNDDDTRNHEYYKTSSPSSSANAMSDFNGKENTKIITDLATAQSDWKTSTAIRNDNGIGYYPAACCCWRYHTEGTKQGDWYLPACGELGYIMPKFNKINEAIIKLRNGYVDPNGIGNNIGIVLGDNKKYLCSSEGSSSSYLCVNTRNGVVNRDVKGNYDCVRACLRVK